MEKPYRDIHTHTHTYLTIDPINIQFIYTWVKLLLRDQMYFIVVILCTCRILRAIKTYSVQMNAASQRH